MLIKSVASAKKTGKKKKNSFDVRCTKTLLRHSLPTDQDSGVDYLITSPSYLRRRSILIHLIITVRPTILLSAA